MRKEDDLISEDKQSDDFSLESILAEYKGSAFINSEKRTPTAQLNEQAEKILNEAIRQSADLDEPVDEISSDSHVGDEDDFDFPKAKAVDEGFDFPRTEAVEESFDFPKTKPAEESFDFPRTKAVGESFDVSKTGADDVREELDATKVISGKPISKADESEENDNAILFFDNYRSADSEQDTIVKDVKTSRKLAKSMGIDIPIDDVSDNSDEVLRYGFDDEEYQEGTLEDFMPEEPSLKDAANKFASLTNSISLRCIPVAIVTLIMVILTFSFEAGMVMPFGIGYSIAGATGMLMLGLLFVMMLCADLLVRGYNSLVKLTPNAESLILVSAVFSIITSIFTMFSDAPQILPYNAVSALTLTFAAFGEKFNLRAITETLKTAAASSEPYGVQAEYNEDIDKSVLKKAYNRTDGFYNNLMHPDISELMYRYAAPGLLGLAVFLSLITVIFRGGNGHFLHSLSATLAAAAPFSLLLTFSVPFSTVAKAIRRSGAALAGWGGADDVCATDGAGITDEDIFPPGTLSLSGMKLFDGASPEKAIRYTASLVSTSGSGLSVLFEEVLKTQGMNMIRVEDFACYEGGISALIRGERVATGSAAFMNLLGVRVPDDTNIKSAVYTAVKNRLLAMFTVDYTPINSVQGALISLHKWRVKMFFAVRDFNITPLTVEQKFRVPLDNFEFIQTKDSYTISDENSGSKGRMAAILTREGLGPFAQALTGGRLLKSAAFVATCVSVASAVLGVIMMFYMFWAGAFASARPGNLLMFMLAMLAAVLIVCGYVRCKK